MDLKLANNVIDYWLPPKGWDRHTSYSLEAKMLHSLSDKVQEGYMQKMFGSLIE